ncbi:hypothetical protein [Fretibacterium sp. OH1220_COT-178]|uniref:hypothetical protein n=1 Tax=Fretibacterium sp. OH1220_COT-178 TaxID=2491047 RepID=UPI000F5E398A|nr:hypothetical protein [Fretibacterium sp. OH1220_COT-178]RRD64005.1 hypothetical protein EII26_08855 [Fretibacterium sp. OH1220_COT-178]
MDNVEVKSLGPCSEEAEAALTDEEMLSLWYGGLNRIYVQKFREEGRWVFEFIPDIPRECFRAWTWDNPHMRASAYYCKAVFGLLATASMGIIFGCSCIGSFLDRMKHTSMLENLGLLLRSLAISWGLIVIPLLVLSHKRRYRVWISHYRVLAAALKGGRDADLADRVRMEEMRRTVLGWAWNSGYVRYADRWRLKIRGGRGAR